MNKLIKDNPKPKNDLQKFGSNNAHVLTGDRQGQIAVDVPEPNSANRGSKRVIYDYNIDDNDQPKYTIAGYMDDHDYANAKGVNFKQYHDKMEEKFHQNEFIRDQEQRVLLTKSNEESDEETSKKLD